MILQALNEYYQRKLDDPEDQLAPFGFEWKGIPFVIVLNKSGKFLGFDDRRDADGGKLKPKLYLVPKSKGRSGKNSWKTANVLWDHYGYVLGHPKSDSKGDVEMANNQHSAFVDQVVAISARFPEDQSVISVLNFLRGGDFSAILSSPSWGGCSKIKGCNLAFEVSGDSHLVCQTAGVREFVTDHVEQEEDEVAVNGVCLVTGEISEIEKLHPQISGVNEKPSPFAAVNDSDKPAFSSFGKKQGYNFPVSKKAAFQYAESMNHLLRSGSRQKIRVGDTQTIFWSEKPSDFETMIPDIFGEPPKDNPDQHTQAVAALYRSMNAGLLDRPEGNTRFYILGLAPNAARIAVRFWHVATVAEVAKTIRQHFDDIAIEHGPNQLPHLPLFRLLVSTATLGKADNIPANLAGEFMRTILAGLPYPQTLLASAVRRIHAEHEITYARAALIKGCINRMTRYKNPEIKEELKMALDESNQNIGYRLGRLFAVLEKIQEEASPGLNATIRDRYYSSAASTPVTVFSTLMRLKNHHLGKLHKGRAVNLEKLIGTIVDGFNNFPAHLKLEDQGRFAIGYYHQRQGFFKKHSDQDQQGE